MRSGWRGSGSSPWATSTEDLPAITALSVPLWRCGTLHNLSGGESHAQTIVRRPLAARGPGDGRREAAPDPRQRPAPRPLEFLQAAHGLGPPGDVRLQGTAGAPRLQG